jgi:hypothetical protein
MAEKPIFVVGIAVPHPSWRSSLEVCLDLLEIPKELHAC